MKKIIFILTIISGQLFAQWSEQYTGYPYTIFSLSAVDDNIVWASVSMAFVLRTTDGGQLWQNVGGNIPEPNGFQPCIFGIDANTAIFSCYDGSPVRYAYVYKTTNAGVNWTLVFSQGDDAYISGIWIKPNNEGIMVGWPVGGRWSLWKTYNAGNTWDSSGMYIEETNPAVWSYENGVFYLNNRIWFGARNKGIYYSSNNGSSWTLQDVTWTGYAYPSAIWFEDSNHGYSSADRNIIRTETSGMNWTIAGNSTGTEIIKGITGAGNNWWYVRFLSNKIYYTTDDGNFWLVQYTAPSNSGYNHITKGRNGGNRMWAARIDGGISVYNGPVGIKKTDDIIPSDYRLFQNYPNPFNPVTVISYQLVVSSFASLIVYDALGKEVITLVNEQLKPGAYEAVFDGTNYPSGVYFYHLTTDNFTETKEMVLLK
jgi:photosystem II stability/assembly factor-like uncharacterized protein